MFAEIISKINKKDFKKIDFDMLAKNKNIPIQRITIENLNDNKTLKKEIIEKIYAFGKKEIIHYLLLFRLILTLLRSTNLSL